MPELSSQNDIVREFMARQEEGYEVTDEIKVPGLDTHFNVAPAEAEVIVDTVKVPFLKDIVSQSRKQIAEVIVGLFDYRLGVVGFDWVMGEESLDISYINNFEQRTFETENEREKIMNLSQLVLKIRKNITRIKWDFGKPFVQISCIA